DKAGSKRRSRASGWEAPASFGQIVGRPQCHGLQRRLMAPWLLCHSAAPPWLPGLSRRSRFAWWQDPDVEVEMFGEEVMPSSRDDLVTRTSIPMASNSW